MNARRSVFRYGASVNTVSIVTDAFQMVPNTRNVNTFKIKDTSIVPLGMKGKQRIGSSSKTVLNLFSTIPINPSSIKTMMTTTSTRRTRLNCSTTSAEFAMDPYSEEASKLIKNMKPESSSITPISTAQHKQLAQLAHLVVEWNERLNLISRKDCTVEVVFGRHILPSIALSALPELSALEDNNDDDAAVTKKRVIDVGTGGGFPGVPLAILYPNVDFTLVDSVGKKLKAVEEIAAELQLQNIKTHHGRAEEMVDTNPTQHKTSYDICVGRSVTALPRFCFWIQDFLKQRSKRLNKEGGKLVYIIGGDIDDMVLSRAKSDVPIDDLVGKEGVSDKRTLTFDVSDVVVIANESGERKQKRGVSGKGKKKNKSGQKKGNPKGAWAKRDNAEKKERGYENFKRY